MPCLNAYSEVLGRSEAPSYWMWVGKMADPLRTSTMPTSKLGDSVGVLDYMTTMASDLNTYLASRYLVADTKSRKKRKRKGADTDGLVITQDDGPTLPSGSRDRANNEDELAPVAIAGTSADFRRTKKSGWTAIGGRTQMGDSATAADAILAAAAAENEACGRADDEPPVLEHDGGVIKMSDGTHAGLQSGEAHSAQLKKRQREEREEVERMRKGTKKEEVAYRDATGKRVDVSMRRAEARQMAAAQAEKECRAKEALEGEVQREEALKRREQLEDAKFMAVARHADDEDLNEELKAKQRWNDPMMQFLSARHQPAAGERNMGSKGKPAYIGAAPPNRYGIKPGYRWDGVDRGNGFEAERFKAINRRERNKDLDYSWQMDE
jgi:pre-mRNA-splicing factor CWC26